eukprot:CAMPEP_0174988438 /NCGR_PEP_ID=MMETSP0004_2-20121128/20127_1 /TAXON_ID=420556 /ORGANISM="Ochromonas sp., Strain CCMP1393" /LENGTH=305 /DNA_ID=CAMNT_0016241657 /DNA_START=50 /DNA_END=967 /DNA_ORIENTATION=-
MTFYIGIAALRLNSLYGAPRATSNSAVTASDSSSTIEQKLEITTEEMIKRVSSAVRESSTIVQDGLSARGWAVIDNFLDSDLCDIMRKEASVMYNSGKHFTLSKSTRWDPKRDIAIPYDKHNVFSMQLSGGDAYYDSPRLHEYVVAMTQSMEQVIMSKFPETMLSDKLVSNKLAVCIGSGSAYDKHYDNSGLDDTRKVTVLYYMNPNWRPECGGCFRIYTNQADSSTDNSEPNDSEKVIDIEPKADRLLVFWSDRLVHSVLPSEAPRGDADHRYALTLWMTSTTPEAIARDDAGVKKHFGDMGDV